MPIIDLPLKELYKYNGINPKPKDFDSFWDKALLEIENLDFNIEIKESDFKCNFAECYDMYFTSVKGARIYSKFLKPKNLQKKSPAIIEFHGYGCEHNSWLDKLPYVAEGFCVFSMDCRGQGSGKSEDIGGTKGRTINGEIIRGLYGDGNDLLFKYIFLDTAILSKIVFDFDFIDTKNVYSFGISQGGALSLVCAALDNRISKTCSYYPFLSDYKRVWKMDLCKDAYNEINDFFRWSDPLHEREEEIFTTLGYIDIQNLTNRIKSKVIMFTGLMDTICPPSTQFAAFNKITSEKKVIVYPDFTHEFLPKASEKVFDFFVNNKF